MRRLARAEHAELVDAIGGDTVVNTIAVHGLLSGAFEAYVVGGVHDFTAAVVRPNYRPSSPFAWGDPEAIWRIVSTLDDCTRVEVPTPIAAAVADVARRATGRQVAIEAFL